MHVFETFLLPQKTTRFDRVLHTIPALVVGNQVFWRHGLPIWSGLSVGGCQRWGCPPFLWPPCQDFCPAIWYGEVCGGSSGGYDWAGWRVLVCCTQSRSHMSREEWWVPPMVNLQLSREADGYPLPDILTESWKASVTMAENTILKSVGARAQPCFTPFVTGKYSDSSLSCPEL